MQKKLTLLFLVASWLTHAQSIFTSDPVSLSLCQYDVVGVSYTASGFTSGNNFYSDYIIL